MSNDNPLISVIVPIYNAEETLYDCLLSVASQTHTNIDVILVNDGSTDSSFEIAKKFCEKDTRFRLIDQRNSGVAAAREAGFRAIKGDYVIHTDSDDLMMPYSLECLYRSIKKNHSNLAVGSYLKKYKVGEEIILHDIDNVEEFIFGVFTGKYHGGLWNKLISKELCEGLHFEVGLNYMEDKLFLLKAASKEFAKVSVVKEVVYIYNHTDVSYTNKISMASIVSSVKVTERLCNIYSNRYSEDIISHIKNKNKVMVLLNSNITQRNVFLEANKYILSDGLLPLKHKFILILDTFYLNFIINIYRKLIKWVA